MAGGVLVARTSAIFDFAGQRVMITEGRTTVREGHPILGDHGHLFAPLVPDFDLDEVPAKRATARKEASAREPAPQ